MEYTYTYIIENNLNDILLNKIFLKIFYLIKYDNIFHTR